MGLKTKLGQILLTHPQDENYSSLYEETFSKQGETIELFAVLEISGSRGNLGKLHRSEYEKVLRTIVTALKKTYISTITINQETFERALGTINLALGKLATKGPVNWYGKMQAAVGAIHQGKLAISTTGNAGIYLLRGGDFTLLSEGLAEEVRPVKIFANYTAGKLLSKDRIVISTNQLFNYLSLDKIREYLREDTLEETCQEIISALQEIKNMGFATFIFEVSNGEKQESQAPVPKLPTYVAATPASSISEAVKKYLVILGRLIWTILKFVFGLLVKIFMSIISLLNALLKRKQIKGPGRKVLLIAAVSLILILTASIGYAFLQKSMNKKKVENISTLNQIEQKLNEAEAALIYNNEARVLNILADAEKLFPATVSKEDASKKQVLLERLKNLYSKIAKEVKIDNPTVLTTFSIIPTDLIRSPNGFLVWNRNANNLAFYDFRVGETKPVLANQNLSKLLLGDFFGETYDYLFLKNDAKFVSVNVQEDKLSDPLEVEPLFPLPAEIKIQSLLVLTESGTSRIYILDTRQNEIFRVKVAGQTISSAEKWLKTPHDSLTSATDMAVDGNIYLLYPDHLDKYFNGQKQNFTLAASTPALKNVQKIFTSRDSQFLYLLDPDNERVLIYSKAGKFNKQLRSAKFKSGADIFADEKNHLIYVLAGSELLQVGF